MQYPSLLVVARNDDRKAVLADLFSADGWHVSTSPSCDTAFADAKRVRPVAVLIDVAEVSQQLALVSKLRASAHTALATIVVVPDADVTDLAPFDPWNVHVATDGRPSSLPSIVRDATPAAAKTAVAPDGLLGRPTRLNALAKTGLLDSPVEAPFDQLAQLTAHLLNVPVVLMSLVDRNRQFFKAQVGLPSAIAQARQTPLNYSFCQWVVTSDEDLVVGDVRHHPLLKHNLATAELGVGAYAGVPLHAGTDETLGSVCAIDMRPRDWDARELRALHDVANAIDGFSVLHQAALAPPVSLEEFRAMTAVVGAAVQAVSRLQAAGGARMSADDLQHFLAIQHQIGRRLAERSLSG